MYISLIDIEEWLNEYVNEKDERMDEWKTDLNIFKHDFIYFSPFYQLYTMFYSLGYELKNKNKWLIEHG